MYKEVLEYLEKSENIMIEHNEKYFLTLGCLNLYRVCKEALLKAQEQAKLLIIIKEHKLLNYVLKNPKCAKMYNLKQEEIDSLKEVFLK